MSAPALVRDRLILSRDLADFVISLSGAFQRYAMYPDGHPALDTATRSLAKKLEILFLDRLAVSVGVTPNQLIICGTPTDPDHPLLRDLAGQLHARGVGGIKLYRGTQRSELRGMLRLAIRDADAEPEPSSRWPNVRIYPLNYDHLELLEDDEPAEPIEATELWARRVWLGLARAALGEHLPEQLLATADPLEIAVAVDARP